MAHRCPWVLGGYEASLVLAESRASLCWDLPQPPPCHGNTAFPTSMTCLHLTSQRPRNFISDSNSSLSSRRAPAKLMCSVVEPLNFSTCPDTPSSFRMPCLCTGWFLSQGCPSYFLFLTSSYLSFKTHLKVTSGSSLRPHLSQAEASLGLLQVRTWQMLSER